MYNIRARGRVRRGGERHRLHAAERGLNFAKLGVFRAEIVAPLRDAMRLVDGQHRDFAALEQFERFGFQEPFGRYVNEAQLAARNALQNCAVLGRIVARIERRCRDAVAAKLRDLIAHERDQRRHHDGEPVAQQRRQLVAQRFAAAGRHDRQHVAVRKNRSDDLGLAWAKALETESRAKHLLHARGIRLSSAHG